MTAKLYIEARGDLHGRAIEEWVGKTPDTPAPARVILRVFLRQSRRCAVTGRTIRPGDSRRVDHIIPLKQGGANKESNLQIILDEPHKEKTAIEADQNAKVERIQKKHYGLKQPSKSWGKSKRSTWGKQKFNNRRFG